MNTGRKWYRSGEGNNENASFGDAKESASGSEFRFFLFAGSSFRVVEFASICFFLLTGHNQSTYTTRKLQLLYWLQFKSIN